MIITTLRLNERTKDIALWSGQCRTRDCDEPFSVISEHFQTKIEVLSSLTDPTYRSDGHLHGSMRVTGYFERGGE